MLLLTNIENMFYSKYNNVDVYLMLIALWINIKMLKSYEFDIFIYEKYVTELW